MKIRKGTIQDLPEALKLIMELAEYEQGLDQVTNSIDKMKEDGFGEDPIFEFLVAENNKDVVGLALFYPKYSTWKGRQLHLEDIIVTASYRGKGIGKLLFESLLEEAELRKLQIVSWQVLDWNEPAINFYKKYPTQFDNSWINCSLRVNE